MSDRKLPLPGPLFAAHVILTNKDKSFVVAAYKQLRDALKIDHPDVLSACKRVFVVSDSIPVQNGQAITSALPIVEAHRSFQSALEAAEAYIVYLESRP